MIVSEKSHQNLSDYINFFSSKKYLNMIKKGIISSENVRNSGNSIYDYDHSFFGKDFSSIPLYRLRVSKANEVPISSHINKINK